MREMILLWILSPIKENLFVLMNEGKNVLFLVIFHLEDEHNFIICFLEDVFYCFLLGSFRFAFVIANAEFLHFL